MGVAAKRQMQTRVQNPSKRTHYYLLVHIIAHTNPITTLKDTGSIGSIVCFFLIKPHKDLLGPIQKVILYVLLFILPARNYKRTLINRAQLDL